MIAAKTKVQGALDQIMMGAILLALFFALFASNASAQPAIASNGSDAETVSQTSMQDLLKRYAQQNKGFDAFLADQHGFTLAEGTDNFTEISDLSKLPASPDLALQSAVDSFDELNNPSAFHPPIYLLWLPPEKIGAVFFDEGSAACRTYFLFRSDGKTASKIETPNIFKHHVCGDMAGGAYGFLVGHGHQTLALLFTYDELPPFNQTSYKLVWYWEEWSPAGWKWSPSDRAMITTNSPRPALGGQ